jgi:hypothetical protein
VRDLRFAWEEMPQQALDEQAAESARQPARRPDRLGRSSRRGRDYTDNLPLQCLHPGRPLVRNAQPAAQRHLAGCWPSARSCALMLHNIDTVGADVDPALLGQHIASGACLTFEVITRRIEDRGGGLARVNGRCAWSKAWPCRARRTSSTSPTTTPTPGIDIDRLLAALRADPRRSRDDAAKVAAAVRALAARMPTYITLKDVKKRWGHGQEGRLPGASSRSSGAT